MGIIDRILNRKTILSKEHRALIEDKIFCIGNNKTGTTSLHKAFAKFGFKVGDQREAELLAKDYHSRNFENIIEYCKKSDVFQDYPFSKPDTFKYLDIAFPSSKFILTVRNTEDEWYNSMCNYQARFYGSNLKKPSWNDLKEIDYVYKGWAYENRRKIFKLTESDDPYDRTALVKVYNDHNNDVIKYFENRPDDLLILNLSKSDAFAKFCDFIKVKTTETDFPWENKTSEVEIK